VTHFSLYCRDAESERRDNWRLLASMLTEIYIEALLIDEELADQV
jgi:hypothetical protein